MDKRKYTAEDFFWYLVGIVFISVEIALIVSVVKGCFAERWGPAAGCAVLLLICHKVAKGILEDKFD